LGLINIKMLAQQRVEGRWFFNIGEMPLAGDHIKAGTGDGITYGFGMIDRRDRIIASGNNRGWTADLVQAVLVA
jgi:hypothetical protein